MVSWPAWWYPHTVDVVLVDDSTTTQRSFEAQTKLSVATAVKCRVCEFPASRSDVLNETRQYARGQIRHAYAVTFPNSLTLTAAHQLAWVRPEDGAVLWLQVKVFARSPDGFSWFPATAYCEINEAASPPMTSNSGLSSYTPPSP